MFRFSATSERVGRAVAGILAKEGYGRIATMAFNNASGRGVTDGAKEAWEKLGHKLVAEVIYEPKQPSYRSELQHILAAKPDVVVLGSYVPDTTIIVREALQAGAQTKFIAPGYAITPKLIEALGAAATEGLMSVDYVSSLDSAAYAHFSQRYKEVVGRDVGENFYASCAYDMVHVTALAIEAAGRRRRQFRHRRRAAHGRQSAGRAGVEFLPRARRCSRPAARSTMAARRDRSTSTSTATSIRCSSSRSSRMARSSSAT